MHTVLFLYEKEVFSWNCGIIRSSNIDPARLPFLVQPVFSMTTFPVVEDRDLKILSSLRATAFEIAGMN
jgi:hypothetical protein